MHFIRALVSPTERNDTAATTEPSSTRGAHLEIVDVEENSSENSPYRKRVHLSLSATSTDSTASSSESVTAFEAKRRKLERSSSTSILGSIFGKMGSWLGVSTVLDVSDDEDDVFELPHSNGKASKNVSKNIANSSPSGRFDFPGDCHTNNSTVIDLSSEDSNDEEDSAVELLSVVKKGTKGIETVTLFSSPEDVRSSRNRSRTSSHSHDRHTPLPSTPLSRPVSVMMEEQPEDDDEEDEIAVVGEVTRSPGGHLAATRRSVHDNMKAVISAVSTSATATDEVVEVEEDNSVVAAANERLKRFTSGVDRSAADSPSRSESLSIVTMDEMGTVCSPSPGPEDSASRQHTPKGYYQDSPRTPRSDTFSRRTGRAATLRGKPRFSIERATERFLREVNTVHDETSPINLLARDRYKALLASAGVADGPRSNHSPRLPAKPRTERKLKRLDAHDDLYRRARMALLKLSSNRSSNNQSPVPSTITASNDVEVVTLDSSRPSPCNTPGSINSSIMSCSSVGRGKLDDLMLQMRSVQLRDTDALNDHQRYVSQSSLYRRRLTEAEEAARVSHLSRAINRAEIEEQTRELLALKGIRLPAPKPKVKDEFPPLPQEALDLCDRAWRRGNEGEVFCKGFDQPITRKDLLTLSGLNWLNDEIINCYLQLVCDRNMKDESLPKTYAFNTFFYANINTKGYASVKRWTRKVDIFSFDILLVPVHMNNNHWCMAIIDIGEKRIDYYDSMHGRNQRCLDNLRSYLESESMDKKKQPFNASGWTFNICEDCPEQMNGSDCGMFSCKFAEFASRRAAVTFNQSNMPYYRKRMVYEIATMALM